MDQNELPIPGLDANQKADEVRVIALEEDIMAENDQIAIQVRAILEKHKIYSLNLISSPGSGKTTLLVETLKVLAPHMGCAVIEGDQQTSNDARRIASTGVPVVQVNTRASCHLNALQVKNSLAQLPLESIKLLFIENVGNLVCPAGMDLGEDEKVVLMSITEGEDKPAKYPLAFHLAKVLVLTKMDLLPHLRFDLALCREYACRINPALQIIETSTFTQSGMTEWITYLRSRLSV